MVSVSPAPTYEHTKDFEVWECPGLGRYTFNAARFPHWRWSKINRPVAGPTEKKVSLLDFVLRMQRIAQKNKDDFSFRADFRVVRQKRQAPKTGFELVIFYHIIAEEKAESHVMIDGTGFSFDEAVQSAWGQIEDACVTWGYESVP